MWGIFGRRLPYSFDNLENITVSAFRLHNFLVDHRELSRRSEVNEEQMFLSEAREAFYGDLGVEYLPNWILQGRGNPDAVGRETVGRPSVGSAELVRKGNERRKRFAHEVQMNGMRRPTKRPFQRDSDGLVRDGD